ncbi:MAG: biotin carboxylase N-terminal domain-containing protein [Acidocella sp.]|nr:biotin carboxylase N-terminal domain-containing protein [Acidocella sp.]
MISSVLIANRGEIARRIIRTARRMGIRSIAVFSDADAEAPFVAEADEAICIGPAPARESYLAMDKILAAARTSGAAAIHPGYGFLSEQADFAAAVIDAGLVWVGPKPDAIRAMGLKDAAKALMAKAGVATTPGYHGADQAEARLEAEAEAIGYPVLIKAVAGGGGKGMRKVERAGDFPAALAACRREAMAAFGDDRVLLERYVARPRHIEVQIFGDGFGNVVHLFERDCSVQRRHQKVIEEAPAPGMDETVRAAICEAAVKAGRAVDYEGAGTIEFIADGSEGLRADRIWFMEMNTRLQVEHPVTEAITGLDLVEWQLRVAAGEKLPLAQSEITRTGHAIEARLYAETPETGFLPSIGRIAHLRLPTQQLRVDSAVEAGTEVTPYYDPMIAKLIAHAATREMAVGRLATACEAVEIWPVNTNAAFLARALRDPVFGAGGVDTGFIPAHMAALCTAAVPSDGVLAAAAMARLEAAKMPAAWRGFRLNAPPSLLVRLQREGVVHEIGPASPPGRAPNVVAMGDELVVFDQGHAFAFRDVTATPGMADAGGGDGTMMSPMPGHILSVAVAEGERVAKGAALVVMEAMKMELTLSAPFDGVVTGLVARLGARVAEGVVLCRIEADTARSAPVQDQ